MLLVKSDSVSAPVAQISSDPMCHGIVINANHALLDGRGMVSLVRSIFMALSEQPLCASPGLLPLDWGEILLYENLFYAINNYSYNT